MVECRPVSRERTDDAAEILQYAFMPEQGPNPDAYELSWPPALYDLWGVFDGGDLVSVCKLYRMTVTGRRSEVIAGGIGALATAPERRREGYARRLTRQALETFHEEGVLLATLWPFDAAFHRALGWGTAAKFTRYELPPEQLSFARGQEGTLRRLSDDDWEQLQTVESIRNEGTVLSLCRSEQWWRKRTLASWAGRGEPYIYGYERDGTLRGYIVYTIDREAGRSGHEATNRLRIRDIASVDDKAYRALLGFVANHDSQVKTVELRSPLEGELLDQVDDPEEVTCTVENGPMVRLTDVADALERFPWPSSQNATFTLRVMDPLLDRNDGCFAVTVTNGTGTVQRHQEGPVHRDDNNESGHTDGRSGDGTPGSDVDVAVDVSTLSQLCVGTYGLDAARRLGDCTVNPSLQDTLATAFTPQQVRLREFF